MSGLQESLTLGVAQDAKVFIGTVQKISEHNPKHKATRPYMGKSYKSIIVPGHPNAQAESGKIDEHRYLAAKALGKPLPDGVDVHHHGGGKHGGQLVICQDRNYHKLLHIRTRAYEATGDAEKRKCDICKRWDDVSNMSNVRSAARPNGRFLHIECKQGYDKSYYIVNREKRAAYLEANREKISANKKAYYDAKKK